MRMPIQIDAPWTPEVVEELNARQVSGAVHPYTCGSGRRTDAAHLDGAGVLVATPDGWICPYCTYRQMMALVFAEHRREDTP